MKVVDSSVLIKKNYFSYQYMSVTTCLVPLIVVIRHVGLHNIIQAFVSVVVR